MSLSAPSLPYAAKAWSSQLQQDKVEEMARGERQQKFAQKAQKEKDTLEEKCRKKRVDIEEARKLEKLQTWKRMQVDKTKRESRWTHKMEAHPFHVDLWAEDEQLYAQNRASDSQTRLRERASEKAASKDQADRRRAEVAKVDQLDILRKEKKKLQEDRKELKARLDLDKVNRRCDAAKYKADIKVEAHQCKLADMGLLDRSHSDFFTELRLNSAQIDKKCQWVKQQQLKNSNQMSISMQSTAAGTTQEQWWPRQELDQVMLDDPDPTE